MKKSLLLSLAVALGIGAIAQVNQSLPVGFRKANLPAALKNYSVRVPYRSEVIDNQVPLSTLAIPHANARTAQPVANETVIGCTFYDLQTNNSISNRLVVNTDGTIAAAWTFSPDAIQTTTPVFPNRGSGYNYYDGANWSNPGCPMTREEGSVRTGFTNIVNTASGNEMLIAHSAVTGQAYNRISVARRATKGTGAWTISYPWGSTSTDTWPKATSAGDNVYVVFQGQGASGSTTVTPAPVLGQSGPIFYSQSTDGGVTFSPKWVNPLIDSTQYKGFGGDSYCIDAKDSIVVLGFGDTYTDVGFLKSTDYGQTWTKTIIQTHPIPFYTDDSLTDENHDGTIDTLFTNGGDIKVLIDNNGLVHAWFSALRYYNDSASDGFYNPMWGTDGLEYWNENMPSNGYVEITASQDYNGNNILDVPSDTFPGNSPCDVILPWGEYSGGITIMPSAGIDASGKIYMTYATINESADTTDFHEAHRHIYMMTLAPPYDPATWTYPYNIIPSQADGGLGEYQEGSFACTGRLVDNTYAYVLYQRDDAPGHGLARATSCDLHFNLGNSSDILLTKVETAVVGVKNAPQNDLFVSQNYPNPSVGMTHINIGLKKSADIRFEVYDIIGKVVYSETRKQSVAGNHTINLNTASFEPGIYTYSVIAGGQKSTRQMIVQ